MSRDSLKTLLHPFDAGMLSVPGVGGRVLFLGAEPGFRLPEGFSAELTAVQGFRPFFRALQSAGYRVAPRAEGTDYTLALVLCGRHRGENEARIAEAVQRVSPGGLVMVAGAKGDGIASLRKRVAALAALDGQEPKYHGLVFWFRRPAEPAELVSALRAGNEGDLVEGRFHTMPGMFSHDRVDVGSRLLAENLPGDLSGAAADFCAGWGYLAAEAARRFPAIRAIDLYDADFEAVEAAKRNLADLGRPARFFWHDLASEPVAERYDAVVMNPPFHQGRAADPGIGQDLIRAAGRALKKGGRLFLVANRPLPYEDTLRADFADWWEITRNGGFKVLAARR
ncbi:methyltransferase [Mesorhizobium sp. L-8-10]|uniref:class I SAM-dependent methyltransferase n=1 Tax=unclassified Mesorhizobium TaxID=325217 RepID=UPI001928BAEF|nr:MULTISPECIES: class I SAM-dependent methyltransferase [unclassified Mesorhizobium]BCH20230.1 methyltransferase [Mesorhizobium sp. L-8-3]BCH28085.1 methyltransferase [Mesorhizobium sp. L-8-10]